MNNSKSDRLKNINSLFHCMKILISGADGQLGKAFIHYFQKSNIEYIATNRFNFDISNNSQMYRLIEKNKIHTLINCAAYNHVDNAEKEPELANKINGYSVKYLSELSKKFNFDLIHFSTNYVFDGEKKIPYTAEDKPNPISVYGKSKYLGEKMISENCNNYYLIRTSWVFGDGHQNFVHKLLQWSESNTRLQIVDNEISSPTLTYDLAKATIELLHKKKYGLYHITNSDYCSRYEWAKFILQLIKWQGDLEPVKSSFFKSGAFRPMNAILDHGNLKSKINYELPNWRDATIKFLKLQNLIVD